MLTDSSEQVDSRPWATNENGVGFTRIEQKPANMYKQDEQLRN